MSLEDNNLKRYMKSFVTDSIFKFYSRIETAEQTPETQQQILRLTQFLEKLESITKTLNQKPKQLLEVVHEVYSPYCSEQETLSRLCYFLQECPLIEGAKLTEALGSADEKFEPLRKAFLSIGEFKGKEILESMRSFFFGFYMTGETQVIDRVIGQFSEEYIEQNPVASADSGQLIRELGQHVLLPAHDPHPQHRLPQEARQEQDEVRRLREQRQAHPERQAAS